MRYRSGTNRWPGARSSPPIAGSCEEPGPHWSDGEREDDGSGAASLAGLCGPIIRDRLFFFGAYQGTIKRQVPASNIAFVPTPAMLAGDFTTFASAGCNGGRQVTLGAPFVGNRVDPARFSVAAVNFAKQLPATTDPCGQVTYRTNDDLDEQQPLGRVDYQWSSSQTIFGRYLMSRTIIPPGDPNASLLERVGAVPGVVGVGASHALPFSGLDSLRPFIRADQPEDAANPPVSEYRIVTPGYFAAMGIPLTRGREFTDADGAGRPGAIVVNESFAAKCASRQPDRTADPPGGRTDLPWLTVVGVSGDVSISGLLPTSGQCSGEGTQTRPGGDSIVFAAR